jgi:hypothetical protein
MGEAPSNSLHSVTIEMMGDTLVIPLVDIASLLLSFVKIIMNFMVFKLVASVGYIIKTPDSSSSSWVYGVSLYFLQLHHALNIW